MVVAMLVMLVSAKSNVSECGGSSDGGGGLLGFSLAISNAMSRDKALFLKLKMVAPSMSGGQELSSSLK